MEESIRDILLSSGVFKMICDVIRIEDAGICVTDLYTNQILFANSKMALYTGEADAADLIGQSCRGRQNAGRKYSCPFCSHMNLLDRHGNPLSPCIREQYVEDRHIWLKIINQAVKWTNGRLIRIVTFYDITEMKKTREQFSDILLRDRLLGLKDSACLEQEIREAPVKPSLLLLEVLSMRKIKEYYGWEIGDYLLCTIRDAILSRNVPNSELYRISEDKFCLAIGSISRLEIKKLANDLSAIFTGTWTFEYEGTTMQAYHNASLAVIHSGYIRDGESPLNMTERILARARERKKVAIYNNMTASISC